jgi:hypothetical protein
MCPGCEGTDCRFFQWGKLPGAPEDLPGFVRASRQMKANVTSANRVVTSVEEWRHEWVDQRQHNTLGHSPGIEVSLASCRARPFLFDGASVAQRRCRRKRRRHSPLVTLTTTFTSTTTPWYQVKFHDPADARNFSDVSPSKGWALPLLRVEIEDKLRLQFVSLSGQLKKVKNMLAQCENNPDEGNKAWAKRVEDGIPQVRHKCVELRKIMLQVRLSLLSLSLPPLWLLSTVRP